MDQLLLSSTVKAAMQLPGRNLLGEGWCNGDSSPIWDGEDLSACFRIRTLNGIIPAAFLCISLVSLVVFALSALKAWFHARSSSSSTKRRLSIASAFSGTLEDDTLQPITAAENEAILEVIEKESPDLQPEEIWGLKIDPSIRKPRRNTLATDVFEEEGGQASFGVLLGALWQSKKDVLNVVGASAVLGLLVWRYLESGAVAGRKWMLVLITAWVWTIVLAVLKTSLYFRAVLRRLVNPSIAYRPTPIYTLLEILVIPWFFLYTLISFFDLRSSLILYYEDDKSPMAGRILGRDSAIFGVVACILLVELFAPRASRFSNRNAIASKGDLIPSIEMNASLFSLVTFSFMDPFMFRHAFPGKDGPKLDMKAVPDLRPDDKTARVLLAYRRDAALLNWDRKCGGAGGIDDGKRDAHGFSWKLLYHFRHELLAQQFWAYIQVVFTAFPPLLLQQILIYVGKRQRGEYAPTHVAVLYAFAMLFFQNAAGLAASQGLYIGRRICVRLRSIIVGEIFTKALRRKDMAGASAVTAVEDPDKAAVILGGEIPAELSEAEKKKKADQLEEELEKASSGKIVNLISVDTFRLSEICAYLHFVWPQLPLVIVVSVVLLFRLLGWSAAAGVAVLLIIMPIQAAVSRLFYKYQKKLLAAADARLNLATEVIASVRIVKYFSWEAKFLEKMAETREKELHAILLRGATMVLGGMLMFGSPVIVSVATFTFHTKVLKRDLNAETAFTALALFNVLRGPLEAFTDMLINVLQAHVSLKRIDEFLSEEETDKYTVIQPSTSANDPTIGFRNAAFTWSGVAAAQDDLSVFRIQDLNLSFPSGKLSLILGPVGSGKSTLLLSLLGETNCLSGSAFLPSPVARSASDDPSILTETAAYCSQTPWLLSDTIKENILFGSAFNEERYKQVLHVCALEPDLNQFELRDLTEVGEKGTVLSGGQKARISLARAIYSPARHVLLDDVLSAVDSHTGQHLFEKCLKGPIMKHRSCVLVTHAADLCLPGASFVVSMDNGHVLSSGSPDGVALASAIEVNTDASPVKKAARHKASSSGIVDPAALTIEAVSADVTDDVIAAKEAEEKRKRQEELKLIKDEAQNEGAVSREVYTLYIRAMGGWSISLGAVAVFIVAQGFEIAVGMALRYWAQAYDDAEASSFTALVVSSAQHSARRWQSLPRWILHGASSSQSNSFTTLAAGNPQADHWLKVYCLVATVSFLLYGLRVGVFLWRGVVASRVLYRELIDKILGAKVRFFDSTPTGRILNRLSKDMETVDQDVSMCLMFMCVEIFSCLGIIGSISAVLPQFLAAALVIVLIFWGIGYVYLSSSRELKRNDSVTKSPIFGLFGETLNGVTTIRAYGDSGRFTKQVFNLLNLHNRPFFALWQANRWLSVRIDAAGALVTFAASMFILAAKDMDAALAGFILSFAIAFMERILWVVRLWSQIEINFNSVERVREYLQIEQENRGGEIPPAVWPSRDGSIEVERLTASYAPELAPVLKDVSFKVQPREKVGICGRTGSGKSTLGLSFFRFIEPSCGRIVIDGLDINTLKLSELRSRLTIVAQESALFAGTLRFNLDPFDAYSDQDIWDALKRVQMASPGINTPGLGMTPRATPGPSRVASRTPSEDGSDDTTTEETDRFVVKSLEMSVAEGGKNFSAGALSAFATNPRRWEKLTLGSVDCMDVGQRQLLALARGILKLQTSSILILDESTASLDSATDERIQKTIREEMSEATILCIAHRLRTIIDYDKILLLGAGEVVEYDAPWTLLENPASAFSELCQKSGEYAQLKELAEAARVKASQK